MGQKVNSHQDFHKVHQAKMWGEVRARAKLSLGQGLSPALRMAGTFTGSHCLPGLHGGAGNAAGWTADLHPGADAAGAGAGDTAG